MYTECGNGFYCHVTAANDIVVSTATVLPQKYTASAVLFPRVFGDFICLAALCLVQTERKARSVKIKL